MLTSIGHLTYCTNIHTGEHWHDHFSAIRKHLPEIKKKISPDSPFGIGLRLSHLASLELGKRENLEEFKQWLEASQCYVFTFNGFPYGGFHNTKVKDKVHAPDWTTQDRVLYTIRLFNILSSILPEGMDGGISTSPLSYKHWHNQPSGERSRAMETATWNVLQVVEELIRIRQTTGQVMHLDIEPEPDGLLESGAEFMDWYEHYLLPMGVEYLARQSGHGKEASAKAIQQHVQLCYDICHFAVGYESHASVLKQLEEKGIRVGKIQISAALRAGMSPMVLERKPAIEAFRQFNELTYLHQVVALLQGGDIKHYPDLPDALEDAANPAAREWRSHFHVPLFIKDYGALKSTQDEIQQVLAIQMNQPFTQHLEVETYTWEVLPEDLKLSLTDSIIREMEWVLRFISGSKSS